ncbi:hypothetical protein IAI10_08985 [Clostridium sp. 19966]|uniref:hypothetical protein n=1 Tax=Clostridium sp. 19966 TaxID=2768166 RepID=UPI0028DF6A03|nr:hypothetical protein [Clostridium sp. 19966]MDT8716791.1 hypothetical protein [Clostridium sp. 19966]
MLLATLTKIIGVILLIFYVGFFIKNVFMDFKESDNPAKTYFVVIIGALALLAAAAMIGEGTDLASIINYIKEEGSSLSQSSIEVLKAQEARTKNIIAVIYLVQCVISVSWSIVFVSINREVKARRADRNGGWNWSKLN